MLAIGGGFGKDLTRFRSSEKTQFYQFVKVSRNVVNKKDDEAQRSLEFGNGGTDAPVLFNYDTRGYFGLAEFWLALAGDD